MTSENPGVWSLFRHTFHDFRSNWQTLTLTAVAFKTIAYIILTPLWSLLLRGLLAAFGEATRADMDLVYFFLGPYGWFSLVVLGSVALAIIALEQAALTAMVYAGDREQHLRPIAALKFAASRIWPVLQLTTRIVAISLVVAAPFLVIAGIIYFTLLTAYDINYYMNEKPPVFVTCLAVGAILSMGLAALLLRLFTGWFFALPLILFENVHPRDALRRSSERLRGRRRFVFMGLAGWFAVTTAISVGMTAVVAMTGQLIMPDATASLHVLAVRAGFVLMFWIATGLAVNLFSTTTFSTMLFRFYRQLGCDEVAAHAIPLPEEASSSRSGLRLTRMRFIAVVVGSVLLATGIGVYALQSIQLEEDVQVIAHRGSSSSAPENTMAAIRQAIEDGAGWVEIDVQETADGRVVVFHDQDFMRLAGRDLKIWNATMDDLRDIDIGSHHSSQFRNERVPTLDEVLVECDGKTGVLIELKYYGHEKQLEQQVADIVRNHGMDDQVKAMSLKISGVKKMKAIRPDWKVGLLMSVAAGRLKNLDADFLAINASFADRSLIRSAHATGKEVYVWTVNDRSQMSTAISRGVDGVITDKPALARSVINQRAGLSASERLLLEIASLLGATPEAGAP